MSTAAIAVIVDGISAAIKAAPAIKAVYNAGKDYVKVLFSAGLIDKATQQRIHDHVEQILADALAGKESAAWTVEADPT